MDRAGTDRRRTRHARRIAVVAVAVALLSPTAGGAQESDPEAEREELQSKQADVAEEIDVLATENHILQHRLGQLEKRLKSRKKALAEAESALEEAEDGLAATEEMIEVLTKRITLLERAAEELVVDSFMDPPMLTAVEMFRSESLNDAAVMEGLLEMQAEADADVLERLDQAYVDLDTERAEQAELAEEATRRRADAEEKLAEVEETVAEQQELAAEVEAKLEAKLAEAEMLKRYDEELAAKLAAEQAGLAHSLQGVAVPSGGSSTITPAPGGLATVSCPTGGSITVAGSIADNVQALLNASAGDGIALCGWGYRDPQQQIELRKQHCGTSHYAIYEMPSSQCSPPTARPGMSNHERGLAIDFTCSGGSISSRSSPCFVWLNSHAASYGLYNLPSEPWHWSVDGG